MKNDDTIQFSQRMEQLPPYLFGMINRMKMEKRRKGDDVIDLGMGNPIDPAPEAVTQKLCEEEGENYLRLAMVENEHRIRQAIRQMRRALPNIKIS
jgi:aspartate/methionine/tyrosine aminotransferase